MRRIHFQNIGCVLALLFLTGCETLSYYSQSVGGQLDVLMKRRDIDAVIADESTDPDVRERLASIREMRQFAVTELKLPDNASYTSYSDLGRRHVVWNVFAAPEFSVAPMTWCFPVVGCVVYRGYFSEERARQYADSLDASGFDTWVGGINAYSTLGWFSDPVLNTFLGYSEPRLAGLLFHELTHQKIYIKGDSVFNESLATAVELEGIRRWLQTRSPARIDDAMNRIQRSDDVTTLLLDTRNRLEKIYARNISDAKKRAAKKTEFQSMRDRYAALRESWGGYSGYDAYFAQEFNNAALVTAAAYHSHTPAFAALLQRVDGDMDLFWGEVERIGGLDDEGRAQALEALTGGVRVNAAGAQQGN